ncbi:hypothetical protein [Lysobacter gummosus]|uniref:hypothetical protein n=1 Tax=Lysobacter gummosus TaxID=262324 RepID=UPI00363AE761
MASTPIKHRDPMLYVATDRARNFSRRLRPRQTPRHDVLRRDGQDTEFQRRRRLS